MPLKEGNRRYVDEDVLASLGVESLAPHLNLDGFGGVLHHFGDDHGAEAADEADDAFNNVNDQSSQHVLPGLWVDGRWVGGWGGRHENRMEEERGKWDEGDTRVDKGRT